MIQLRFLFIILLVVAVSACAASTPALKEEEPGKKTMKEELLARLQPADEALLLNGLALLPEAQQKNDYSKVKDSLAALVSSHPDSKWKNSAKALLGLLEELEACRKKLSTEEDALEKNLIEKTRALQENEQLKKEIRLLNEKFQTELTGLQQENEQLKKGLQLLKALEMQLDQREKKLR